MMSHVATPAVPRRSSLGSPLKPDNAPSAAICGILRERFLAAPGRRLTWIMVRLCRSQGESDRQHQHRSELIDWYGLHYFRTHRHTLQRVGNFGTYCETIAERADHA